MNWKIIGGGLICFAIGGVSGTLLTSRPTTTSGVVESRTAPPPRVSGWTRRESASVGRADITQSTEGKPRKENPQADKLIEVPMSLLQTLSRAKATRHIDQPILDDRDPVEAALLLKESEKQTILGAWRQAREDLRQLEIRSLKSSDLEDGSVQLKLPDLSAQRGQVAQYFMNSLTGTLGEDRGQAFYALKQVGDVFAANSGERSITVKVESVGEMRYGYRMTLEDASGKRVWVGDRIPAEIRHLADASGIFPTISEVVESIAE